MARTQSLTISGKIKKSTIQWIFKILLADGEGFEPPKVLFHTLSDFKSDAFNRSANHPDYMYALYITAFFKKRKYFQLSCCQIHK